MACNIQCSKFNFQLTSRTGLQVNFQNFYGFSDSSPSPCNNDCPTVFAQTFDAGVYTSFFGTEKVYGCFFGTVNGEADWWLYTLVGQNGVATAIGTGKCPSTCMSANERARFRQKGLLPAQIENCDTLFSSTAGGANATANVRISNIPSPSSFTGPKSQDAPSSSTPVVTNNSTVTIASVVAAIVVAFIGAGIAYFIIRRRRTKSHNITTRPVTPIGNTSMHSLHRVPTVGAQPALNATQTQRTRYPPVPPGAPLLTSYIVVPSINVASFQNSSEQSALDEIETLRDKIHGLASLVVTSNPPSLKLYPDSATYFSDADQSSANITVLKNKITSQIYNTIFSHFHQGAYHHTIANILWEKRILHQYATNPYFRVDATGKMFLEPELIYSVLVDLATSVSPADTSTIPDPFLSNLISSCVSGIMTHLSPLETPNNSGAMFKFAVTRIVKESVVVLLKLRRCDARYTVFLPKEGDPFDSLRMSTINHGNVVAFSWGVGWEKKKDDGEDVVKILAQVWVK